MQTEGSYLSIQHLRKSWHFGERDSGMSGRVVPEAISVIALRENDGHVQENDDKLLLFSFLYIFLSAPVDA